MEAANQEVEPPFGPPDVVWEPIPRDSELPEGSIKCGQHKGSDAYIGRVRHGGELLIGTAVPSAGICYIAKEGNVTELTKYEIVTVPVGDPLVWEMTSGNNLSRNALKSGKAKDQEILYVGRYVKNDDTYIGWVHPVEGRLHVNVDGKEKTYNEYELLVHSLLDRLCICPPCIRPPCAPPLD